MRAIHRVIVTVFAIGLLFIQSVYAAQISNVSAVRIGNYEDKIRIVFDVDALPDYQHTVTDDAITLKINNTVYGKGKEITRFKDYVVDYTVFSKNAADQSMEWKVYLKRPTEYRIFVLKNPNRLVVDIVKKTEYKKVYDVLPGITYTDLFMITKSGPISANVAVIDPAYGYKIAPALSNGRIKGLESLADLVERENGIVGINGSYFNADGSIIGLLKIDGTMVSMPDKQRTAVGVMPDNKLIFGAPAYQAIVKLPGGEAVNLDGINYERGPNGIILYNHYFGETTATNDFGDEYLIEGSKVTKIWLNKGNNSIPAGGVILSVHGNARNVLSKVKEGDTVEVQHGLPSPWDKAVHILGAGPTLVRNNKVFLTTQEEEFAPDIAYGRAPRSAVGVTGDGKILLAVIDGRSADSIGMTLNELAGFMVKQGARDAMNLDGGGSSEMMIKKDIVNHPSDGRERSLGSALIIRK